MEKIFKKTLLVMSIMLTFFTLSALAGNNTWGQEITEEMVDGIIASVIILIVLAVPIIPFYLWFKYKHKQEKERNNLIQTLAEKGQQLTPELIDKLSPKKNHTLPDQSTRVKNGIFKISLGIGLLLVIILMLCLHYHGFELLIIIFGVVGFFLLAQGLGNYLSVLDERKYGNSQSEQKDSNLQDENE